MRPNHAVERTAHKLRLQVPSARWAPGRRSSSTFGCLEDSVIFQEFVFPFDPRDRGVFTAAESPLISKWAEKYPFLFDELDIRTARNPGINAAPSAARCLRRPSCR